MKNLFYCLAIAGVLTPAGCNKNNGKSCDLPSTPVPAAIVGEWAKNSITSLKPLVTIPG